MRLLSDVTPLRESRQDRLLYAAPGAGALLAWRIPELDRTVMERAAG